MARRVFIAVYMLVVGSLSFILPPFEGMDEGSHFLRAVAIADGHLLPASPPAPGGRPSRGAPVEFNAALLAGGALGPMAFRLDRDVAAFRARLMLGQSGRQVYAPHSNTAIYAPIGYAPQALAIAVARWAGAPPLLWLYAGRIAGVLAFGGLLAFGCARCPGMAPLAGLIAVLPIVPFQVASLTSDTVLLGAGFVFSGTIGRMLRGARLARIDRVAMVLATVVVGSGKIAYLGLAVLPVAASLIGGDRRARATGLSAAGACIACSALWMALIRHDVVPVRFDSFADPAAQARWMLAHPVAAAGVIGGSGLRHLPVMLLRMGGAVIGQDNIWVPLKEVFPLLLAIALAIGSTFAVARTRSVAIVIAAVAVASYLLITTLLFLQWTDVGAGEVKGVQGRYLLPFPIAFAALPVPAVVRRTLRVTYPVSAVLAAVPCWQVFRFYWS